MTVSEIKNYTRVIDRESKKIAVSKKSSRDFLSKVGICRKDGKLTKAYR